MRNKRYGAKNAKNTFIKRKRRAVTSKRINIEEREKLEAYEKENVI